MLGRRGQSSSGSGGGGGGGGGDGGGPDGRPIAHLPARPTHQHPTAARPKPLANPGAPAPSLPHCPHASARAPTGHPPTPIHTRRPHQSRDAARSALPPGRGIRRQARQIWSASSALPGRPRHHHRHYCADDLLSCRARTICTARPTALLLRPRRPWTPRVPTPTLPRRPPPWVAAARYRPAAGQSAELCATPLLSRLTMMKGEFFFPWPTQAEHLFRLCACVA